MYSNLRATKFSSLPADSNLDISCCQGRDRGPLPNSFHDLRFANSAVNTGKVGGNIVKFYQEGEGESWPSLQGEGGEGHSEFWRETACAALAIA